MNTFMHDNKYYIGANYWESKSSINMWKNFSAETIDADFAKLANAGIRTLRMFLTWPQFQPIKAIWSNATLYEYRFDDEDETPLPDTEAGKAGVSEEACDNFATFCKLAEKHGIALIVGLLTGHMSFRHYAPSALEHRNFLNDPIAIKWETKFVKYFVRRFKGEPSIVAWDLGNECSNYGGCTPEQAYNWMNTIASAIRESDPTRPVVSGFGSMPLGNEPFNVRDTAELCDITTVHPYHIFNSTQIDPLNSLRPIINPAVRATLYETLGDKPCFVEEVGSIGYTNCSEKSEADFLRAMLWSTFAQGSRGCFWWCAFDQGQLDYAPYDWNNYGSDYGFFRADGSEKPVAQVTREFDRFLADFEYAELPRRTEQAVIIVTRDMAAKSANAPLSSYILAKQANLDVRFAHAEEKLPDSKLYIMPCANSPKPIFLRRLNELLAKVREGATLYISSEQLWRRLPELTGLTVESREQGGREVTEIDGERLTLWSSKRQNVESVADSCEVLARGEDGRPIYVKNSYGKGYIYYTPYAIENQLGDRAHAFDEDSEKFVKFYEKFAAEAASDRAVKSSCRSVLLTEHELDENRRLVIAVNYSKSDLTPEFTFNGGWRLAKFLRGNETVPTHDAVIMEVVR